MQIMKAASEQEILVWREIKSQWMLNLMN